MGTILRAYCSCGFSVNGFNAGGGMCDFQENCSAPALCTKCNSFHILNYLDTSETCPDCGKKATFYNDSELFLPVKEDNRTIFEWYINDEIGSFILPDTKYLCPHCMKKEMRFEEIGYFD